MKPYINMLIEPKENFKKPLADLWHEVFGDDYGYINLLFDFEFDICDTFVKECDGKIVSALYLLRCNIDFEEKQYHGRYLYAAATSPEYRGKGIMGELIKEAQKHCEKENLDFISLVPGNDGLYDYYSKFGFETAMHRYETEIRNLPHSNGGELTEIASLNEVEKLRHLLGKNKFYYEKEDMKYAFGCIIGADGVFLRNTSDSYFITDEDRKTVYEFISDQGNLENNIIKLLSHFGGDIKIYSPYDLSEYGESKAEKFGMIYPINSELKRKWKYTDIYMNLALN